LCGVIIQNSNKYPLSPKRYGLKPFWFPLSMVNNPLHYVCLYKLDFCKTLKLFTLWVDQQKCQSTSSINYILCNNGISTSLMKVLVLNKNNFGFGNGDVCIVYGYAHLVIHTTLWIPTLHLPSFVPWSML
jgi:hypothetical protein